MVFAVEHHLDSSFGGHGGTTGVAYKLSCTGNGNFTRIVHAHSPPCPRRRVLTATTSFEMVNERYRSSRPCSVVSLLLWDEKAECGLGVLTKYKQRLREVLKVA